MTMTQSAARKIRRVLRIGKALATDKRIPKWVRVLLAIGCVQIPVLPTDEICLATGIAVLAIRYRPALVAIVRETR